MGSDARVYVFDHERYVSLVVPIVHEWLRTLHLEDPLDATLVSYDTREGDQPVGGTELLAHSTTLGRDLRHLGDANAGAGWFDDWSARRCGSTTCLSRATCPWHSDERWYAANRLIEWLIARTGCLAERAFVGRTTTVGKYADLLSAVGHGPQSRLRVLLDALGSRGRVIGYQWMGSAEGIHGWLDAEEARDLAVQLDSLVLPEVGNTQPEIDADHASRVIDSQSEFGRWSLAVVRAIARIARSRSLGLLWGNEIPWDTPEDVASVRAWFDGLSDEERIPPRLTPLGEEINTGP